MMVSVACNELAESFKSHLGTAFVLRDAAKKQIEMGHPINLEAARGLEETASWHDNEADKILDELIKCECEVR